MRSCPSAITGTTGASSSSSSAKLTSTSTHCHSLGPAWHRLSLSSPSPPAVPASAIRPSRHFHCCRLWLLTPLLLHCSGCLADCRSARPAARPPWTARGPQAHARGCHLPGHTANPAAGAARGRPGRPAQAALWSLGAHAQCRTWPGPPQKKRLTGLVALTTRPDPAASAPADYETLRTWACTTPRPRSAPAGVALVIRQGLATWLQVWASMPLVPRPRSTPPLAAIPLDQTGPDHSYALITVLATMVEHAQQEGAR